ncbi:MAG: hypothetical protein WA896_00195 [Spirulinaceae cyanobacterium]
MVFEAAQEIAVYAIDECHLLGDDLCGQVWGQSIERVKIQIENSRNRQTYYGALNILEKETEMENRLSSFCTLCPRRKSGRSSLATIEIIITKVLSFWQKL